MLIHRAEITGRHDIRGHADRKAVGLRIGSGERIAVGLAFRRAVGIEDNGVLVRIVHFHRRPGCHIIQGLPLPDDVGDFAGRRRGSRGGSWRWRHAADEGHALLAAGRLQRQTAGAVRAAGHDRPQQLEVLLVQRVVAAGCHGHRAQSDGETALLRIRPGEGVAVGLAAQRAVVAEDDGVGLRVGDRGRFAGRPVGDARPLPDDVRDRVGWRRGRWRNRRGGRVAGRSDDKREAEDCQQS